MKQEATNPQNKPKHVAIIMDGNGRWAASRHLPRIAGHSQGTESVRAILRSCREKDIEILTLFAFSSENWSRPKAEVDFLLSLFLRSLKDEMQSLTQNNIRLKVIGDRSVFSKDLQETIAKAESLTAENSGLLLNIALNYGGRWDIVQAAQQLCKEVKQGKCDPEAITEKMFQSYLSLSPHTDPDLLIRTSGEQRISNFLLWDLAYTELYFTDTLWPDFREAEFELALSAFANRQRRFGNAVEKSESEQA